jgi:hypothetical protein
MGAPRRSTDTANGTPVIRTLTQEQARRKLDREAHRRLGISGSEFVRRMDAGELEYRSDEITLASLALLVR